MLSNSGTLSLLSFVKAYTPAIFSSSEFYLKFYNSYMFQWYVGHHLGITDMLEIKYLFLCTDFIVIIVIVQRDADASNFFMK